MSLERWRQIDALFGAALELPPEQRGAFLESACGGDRSLLDEVEALLARESDLEDFLEEPAVAAAPSPGVGDPVAGGVLGTRIGSYRLEREIDRGGMGAVYLAVRADDELSRRVAIKVLRPGERRQIAMQVKTQLQTGASPWFD